MKQIVEVGKLYRLDPVEMPENSDKFEQENGYYIYKAPRNEKMYQIMGIQLYDVFLENDVPFYKIKEPGESFLNGCVSFGTIAMVLANPIFAYDHRYRISAIDEKIRIKKEMILVSKKQIKEFETMSDKEFYTLFQLPEEFSSRASSMKALKEGIDETQSEIQELEQVRTSDGEFSSNVTKEPFLRVSGQFYCGPPNMKITREFIYDTYVDITAVKLTRVR